MQPNPSQREPSCSTVRVRYGLASAEAAAEGWLDLSTSLDLVLIARGTPQERFEITSGPAFRMTLTPTIARDLALDYADLAPLEDARHLARELTRRLHGTGA